MERNQLVLYVHPFATMYDSEATEISTDSLIEFQEEGEAAGSILDDSALPDYWEYTIEQEDWLADMSSTDVFANASSLGLQTDGPQITAFLLNPNCRTLVKNVSANLQITIAGYNLEGKTILVYLDRTMQLGKRTVGVGTTTIQIPSAPATPGTYELIAEVDGQELATTTVEVVDENPNIWRLNSRENKDGFLEWVFLEEISFNSSKVDVTIDGTPVEYTFDIENRRVIVNVQYQTISDGSAIVLKGLKYPVLYPSYSFTFTVSNFVKYQSDYGSYQESASELSVSEDEATQISGTLYDLVDENWIQFTPSQDFSGTISLTCADDAVIASLIGPDGVEREIGLGESFAVLAEETYYIKVCYDLFATFQESAYTIMITPSPSQIGASFPLTLVDGDEHYIPIKADDIASFYGKVCTLTFDTAMLELLDFAAQTPGLTITGSQNGTVTFTVDKTIPSGKVWSGVLMVVKFKATATGTTTLTVA